jgi:hypothetical protein
MAIKYNNRRYGGQDGQNLDCAVVTGAVAGDAVAYTGDLAVGRGDDNDPFFGVLQAVQDGRGAVRRKGLTWIGRTAAAITRGPKVLLINGAGRVKVKGAPAAGDKVYEVLADDATNLEVLVDLG